MGMTGGPRRRRPGRLAIGLVTIGVLVGLGIVGIVALRPGPAVDGPVATAGPPPTSASAPMSSPGPLDPAPDGVSYQVLKVVDGDTVHVLVDGQDETVRIIGIDTPETDECWGSEATDAATSLLEGTSVGLVADPTQADRDRYGRLLRYVVLPDGTDFGLRMIGDGNADEYTYDDAYSRQQEYRDADAAAADVGRGKWNVATCDEARADSGGRSSPSAEPSTLSSATRSTADTGPDGCAIKGNVSSNGRIYHVPGSRDYDRTSIDESRGERWFCSEDEALAAGWRARGS